MGDSFCSSLSFSNLPYPHLLSPPWSPQMEEQWDDLMWSFGKGSVSMHSLSWTCLPGINVPSSAPSLWSLRQTLPLEEMGLSYWVPVQWRGEWSQFRAKPDLALNLSQMPHSDFTGPNDSSSVSDSVISQLV